MLGRYYEQKKTGLVAGATGIVGRNLLKCLVTLDDWEIIAVSRRTPDVVAEYRHISVDLLDRDDCRVKLQHRGWHNPYFFCGIYRKRDQCRISAAECGFAAQFAEYGRTFVARSLLRHPYAAIKLVRQSPESISNPSTRRRSTSHATKLLPWPKGHGGGAGGEKIMDVVCSPPSWDLWLRSRQPNEPWDAYLGLRDSLKSLGLAAPAPGFRCQHQRTLPGD